MDITNLSSSHLAMTVRPLLLFAALKNVGGVPVGA